MWPAALTRLFKRRLIYIVILIIMMVYAVTKLFRKHPDPHPLELDDFTVKRTKPLKWRTISEHVIQDEYNYRTNSPQILCENTVQGKFLLTDERGYLCIREDILANGCCDINKSTTKYYTCETCDNSTHCCGTYEHCVSCCLQPDKRPILELAIDVIKGRQAIVYAQVNDQFEFCLVKCRTNSHSVVHENRYRDEKHRFCYGPTKELE